jgi:hypothetical protein
VVSAADPPRSLISVFSTGADTFLSISSSFILTRAEWTSFQTHCYSETLRNKEIQKYRVPSTGWYLKIPNQHGRAEYEALGFGELKSRTFKRKYSHGSIWNFYLLLHNHTPCCKTLATWVRHTLYTGTRKQFTIRYEISFINVLLRLILSPNEHCRRAGPNYVSATNELTAVIKTYCTVLYSWVLVTQMYNATLRKGPRVKDDVVSHANNTCRMLPNLHIYTLFIFKRPHVLAVSFVITHIHNHSGMLYTPEL